ncbi:flagellar biosynthesis protein FlhB [Lutibacter sp. B2]|nr:flagellar biosynthesis protein FlhB [Lutibacter sp. B2]
MSLFKIDLQLFSGEKTENATSKKKKEAREKGQVVQSKEINSALILLSTFLVMKMMGGYIYTSFIEFTKKIFMKIPDIENLYTIQNIRLMYMDIVIFMAKIVIPIMGVAFIVGLVCSYMQVGFLFTTKTLKLDLNKINPINGFKRIFSIKQFMEFIKSMLKIGVLGYITFSYVLRESKNFINIFDMDIFQISSYLGKTSINIGLRAGFVLLILAILDYIYQKWQHAKDLKMSKQEIKEEYKQMEGDPQLKSKIKEKQRAIAMNRMMQDVPKADVIITNPTHYAIAVRYDSIQGDAPIVLAKGKDLIAQNIKKIASENDIVIVENKPLARAIYFKVDIGEYIPPDLYQAVAEVLAYVYKIKNIT